MLKHMCRGLFDFWFLVPFCLISPSRRPWDGMGWDGMGLDGGWRALI